MSYIKSQPKDFIKSLQLIHALLVVGLLGFAVYTTFKQSDFLYFSYKEDKAFLYLAIIISFAGNMASKMIFAKLLKQISADDDLTKKATKYSTAHILRMAMLEFPALMCIIFVMQSYNTFYFILVGVLVLMMLVILPTMQKFKNEVPLTTKEKSILEKL